MSCQKQKKEDALDNAAKMMSSNIITWPDIAVEYLGYMVSKYGVCSEIYLIVFAHYYQAVLRMNCDDENYKIDVDGISWFQSKGHLL